MADAEEQQTHADIKTGLTKIILAEVYRRFVDDVTVDRRQLEWVAMKLRKMATTPSNNRAELQKSNLDVTSGTTEGPNG